MQRIGDHEAGRCLAALLERVVDGKEPIVIERNGGPAVALVPAETLDGAGEQRFKDFAAAASDWFWEMDANLRFIYVSDRLEEITGLKPEEVLGKTRQELHKHGVPEEESQWQAHFAATERHEDFRDFEYSFVRADGERRVIRVSGKAIFDESGRFFGYRGSGRDVTEQRKAEDAHRRSEELLRIVIDHAPAEISLKDEAGGFLMINRELETLFGMSSEDARGKRAADFFTEELAESYEAVDRAVRETGEVQLFETEEKLRDGTHAFLAVKFPIPMPDDGGRGVGTISTDITERKRNERALCAARELLEQRVDERTAELNAAQARLNDAIESIPGAVVLFDRNERLVLCNDAYREQFSPIAELLVPGIALEDLLRAAADHRLFAESEKDAGAWLRRRLCRYRKASGMREEQLADGRWLLSSERRTSDGGIVGIRMDITKRRRTEQELRETSELLTSILDHSTAQIYLKDLEGRHIMVNRESEWRYGGPGSKSMVGKTAHDLFPKAAADVHLAHDRAVIESRQAVTMEYEIPEADADRSFLAVKFPIFDPKGEVRYVGAITSDITEIRAREAALEERRLLLQQAHRVSQMGYWTANPEDPGLSISPELAGLLRRPHEEIDGISTADFIERFVHPDDREVLYAALDAAETLPDWHFESEYRVITADGEERWMREIGESAPGEAGRAVSRIGTLQDITEHKRAAEQLHQAQKMEAVGQLTGGVAHDFNNLLAIILGNAELLEGQLDGEAAELLESIARAGTRGAELTQRLLAFSRRQSLQPRTLDLRATLGGLFALIDRTLGEAIEVEYKFAPQLWAVVADPGQVENAVLNLAINSRDAMPGGGRLTVEAQNATLDEAYTANNPEAKAGDYVVVAVSDNGTGMSPEVLRHAAEPFFTTKGAGRGSGLGLSMVYGFIKQSGGHISIYSEEGLGTTVKLYLPRADAGEEVEQESKSESISRGRGELVLVVEDDKDVRILAIKLLDSLGYRIIDAADAETAISVFEAGRKIDLVLSDVILPGGVNGPAFVQAARKHQPGLKVVFVSGYPAEAATRNGLLDPETVLLGKPFQRRELATALRRALDG